MIPILFYNNYISVFVVYISEYDMAKLYLDKFIVMYLPIVVKFQYFNNNNNIIIIINY